MRKSFFRNTFVGVRFDGIGGRLGKEGSGEEEEEGEEFHGDRLFRAKALRGQRRLRFCEANVRIGV